MKLPYQILSAILLFIWCTGFAQSTDNQIKISGTVKDFNNQPVKNAIIYVDSVRTEVSTNKKGFYKIKLSSNVQHIGASTEEYGLLSTNYTGERRIDFVFRNPAEMAGADDMKIGMVYKQDISKTNSSINRGSNYEDFSSMTQLLNNRFPFVRVAGNSIKVGKASSTFNGDPAPLILLDNVRTNVPTLLALAVTDIGSIRVIRRGSEAAEYGSLGASNGVIIVKTKGGVK